MHDILSYLRQYIRTVHPLSFLLTSLLVTVLIAVNYTFKLEYQLKQLSPVLLRYTGFFLLYGFVFLTAYVCQFAFARQNIRTDLFFYFLLLTGPAIFAAKVAVNFFNLLPGDTTLPLTRYWHTVLNWPLKLLLVLLLVMLVWKMGNYNRPLAGLSGKGFVVKPYFLLLLCMVPLVVFAATRPDFLHTYPKVQSIGFIDEAVPHPFLYRLLFELSYGSDFFTIEFFFRGFLILAFIRYAGPQVILPMATFYCAIHFGKPLFECITSYFGGLILGAVVYYTRSIWGGLIVHLGIAWLMEVAGYVGHQFIH